MKELSPNAISILRRMKVIYVQNDFWPVAVRDLDGVVSSPSTIHRHLLALEREGLIERNPRHPRHGWRPR